MKRPRALAGSLVFLLIAPGVAGGLVPWLLTRWESTSPPLWLEVVGWMMLLSGAAVVVTAFTRFALEGLGRPRRWPLRSGWWWEVSTGTSGTRCTLPCSR